jgi:hypothetical protein
MFSLKNGQTYGHQGFAKPLRFYVMEFGRGRGMFYGVTVTHERLHRQSYATTSPVPSSGVITSLTDTGKERP